MFLERHNFQSDERLNPAPAQQSCQDKQAEELGFTSLECHAGRALLTVYTCEAMRRQLGRRITRYSETVTAHVSVNIASGSTWVERMPNTRAKADDSPAAIRQLGSAQLDLSGNFISETSPHNTTNWWWRR